MPASRGRIGRSRSMAVPRPLPRHLRRPAATSDRPAADVANASTIDRRLPAVRRPRRVERRRLAEPLDDVEEHRRQEDAEQRHAQHAAEHGHAQRPPHLRAGALATISGTTPRMKANEVIRIGRRRSFTASSVASRRGRPASRFSLANSTIRIAFLLARPTSTTKPICVKMLMSPPVRQATPVIELSMHIGTTRMTASGSAQLSYWAASTKNTNTTRQRENQLSHVLSGVDLDVVDLRPLEGHVLGKFWSASRSISRWPRRS